MEEINPQYNARCEDIQKEMRNENAFKSRED